MSQQNRTIEESSCLSDEDFHGFGQIKRKRSNIHLWVQLIRSVSIHWDHQVVILGSHLRMGPLAGLNQQAGIVHSLTAHFPPEPVFDSSAWTSCRSSYKVWSFALPSFLFSLRPFFDFDYFRSWDKSEVFLLTLISPHGTQERPEYIKVSVLSDMGRDFDWNYWNSHVTRKLWGISLCVRLFIRVQFSSGNVPKSRFHRHFSERCELTLPNMIDIINMADMINMGNMSQ